MPHNRKKSDGTLHHEGHRIRDRRHDGMSEPTVADQLRLSDIARIEKDYEDPTRNELFYDRQRAMGIMVAASPDADIIKVGKRVEQKLEQLKAERLPAGMECHKVFYQPERVGSSLGTFILNLIESVIIVVPLNAPASWKTDRLTSL